nr:lactate racemase domain-containing protein [Halarchaeum acidiphilum]
MDFPDSETVDAVLDSLSFPSFATVRYEPATPELDDVAGATRESVDALPLDAVPAGGTVAVGLGSRGIHGIRNIARTVVADLDARGYDPVVVPAMGSHGGATAEGQRETLAGIGLIDEALGCPIDARMDTVTLGTTEAGHEVPFSTAAMEAAGIVVVNRVKAHTNFTGRFESGLCKMLAVGLGKQAGARAVHDAALTEATSRPSSARSRSSAARRPSSAGSPSWRTSTTGPLTSRASPPPTSPRPKNPCSTGRTSTCRRSRSTTSTR